MINFIDNIQDVVRNITERISKINVPEMTKEMATTTAALMRNRIHQQGEASDGTPIGTYSDEYMKQRQRPTFKRSSSREVVLSLTRTMENDWGVQEISNGHAVVFVKNSARENFTHMDIARNAERIYGKKIFSMSEQESAAVDAIVKKHITEAFR